MTVLLDLWSLCFFYETTFGRLRDKAISGKVANTGRKRNVAKVLQRFLKLKGGFDSLFGLGIRGRRRRERTREIANRT